MHDFLGLVVHLHLLARIAVVGKGVDMRYEVHSQLAHKLFVRHLFTSYDLFGLFTQFGHAGSAGTARSLVRGHMHTLDWRQIIDGLESYDHLYGRAVGVGDDIARGVEGVGTVDLWHDQGHVVVHSEGAAIVYHRGSIVGDFGSILLRHVTTGRHKGKVYALEVTGVCAKHPDGLGLASAKMVPAPGTALRPEKPEFVDRHRRAVKNIDKFLTYSARGAHNRYLHFLAKF